MCSLKKYLRLTPDMYLFREAPRGQDLRIEWLTSFDSSIEEAQCVLSSLPSCNRPSAAKVCDQQLML